METLQLEVTTRDKSKSGKELAKANLIPAEYYGRGIENKSFQMDYQTFRRVFRKGGTNTVIELNVDGKEKYTVLVHELILDPITDLIRHVDFINVRMDEEIHTNIPLVFVGLSPAVRDLGGIIIPNLSEVEVKCLPKDLVHNIEVSVDSIIDFHSPVKVKDIKVPQGITIVNDLEETVVTAIKPREENEEAPVAATEGAEGAEGAAATVGGSAEGGDAAKKEGEGEKKD